MTLRVYDPISRRKRSFVPVRPGQVGIYVCGMTVQDRPHLGHMYAFVACDMIRRYLSHLGYAVTLIQNFTDIDDKIIARARSENITAAELAERNIAAYHRSAALLGIEPAQNYPRVTEHIPQIIAYIEGLIAAGHAYVAAPATPPATPPSAPAELVGKAGTSAAPASDVYFAVRSWPDYGQLSGRDPDDLRSATPTPSGESAHDPRMHEAQKRDPLDFALWKAARPEEPAWASPWGPGRPGWHIECSTLATAYLGAHFDFHGGGQDLLFPHHENELAQSRASSGQAFVNHWLHNGLLYLGDRKMSKSDGNFLTVDDLAERFSGAVLRFFLLSVHFRSRLQYGEDRLQAAATGYNRLLRGFARLEGVLAEQPRPVPAGLVSAAGARFGQEVAEHRRRFFTALDDDFNSGAAIGVLFALLRDLNRYLAETGDRYLDPAPATAARYLLGQADAILGLSLVPEPQDATVAPARSAEAPPEVQDQVQQREEARLQRDWARADVLRRQIQELGYEVEDTPSGPRLRLRGE